MTEKRGPGRPSMRTPALLQEICDRIADGESLLDICRDDHMPNRSEVSRWRREDPDFNAAYLLAREAQADAMDDEILETARAATPETASADKVKINALQWRAERLNRTFYGQKQEIDLNRGMSDMSDDELNKLAASLVARLGIAPDK